MRIPLDAAAVGWLLVFLCSAFAFTREASPGDTGFLNREVKTDDATYRYQVYVPPDWNKRQRWPVILFLHGAGERGDDGLIQTEVGIGTAIRRHAERFPAIVVMPQCRRDVWWVDERMLAQAWKALEQSIKEFNGDPARRYLTGLSMGGYGTWAMELKHPGKVAACVVICGGVRHPSQPALSVPVPDDENPYASVAKQVGRTPVWIFHGDADPTVPVDESRRMTAALKAAGGNVKYTEYPNVGHNSWDTAYAEPELMPWLLQQRLGNASSTAK